MQISGAPLPGFRLTETGDLDLPRYFGHRLHLRRQSAVGHLSYGSTLVPIFRGTSMTCMKPPSTQSVHSKGKPRVRTWWDQHEQSH